MGRRKVPKTVEDRPGRPQRDITMQEEIMEELHIVAKDFEEGFYGKDNDLDIEALTEDLEHVINYARDLQAGAPVYPATGDWYMLSKYDEDLKKHYAKVIQKAVEVNDALHGTARRFGK